MFKALHILGNIITTTIATGAAICTIITAYELMDTIEELKKDKSCSVTPQVVKEIGKAAMATTASVFVFTVVDRALS
jgi:hypothetical protein